MFDSFRVHQQRLVNGVSVLHSNLKFLLGFLIHVIVSKFLFLARGGKSQIESDEGSSRKFSQQEHGILQIFTLKIIDSLIYLASRIY